MSIEWNGEGLPPVGCECGARKKSPGAGWWNFKVEHISSGCIFGFWKKSGAGDALNADQYDFMPLNPISTEAERNRKERIGTMNGFIDGFMKLSKGDYSNLAAALHDYLSLIDRLK